MEFTRGHLPRALWRRESGDGLMNKYHSYKRGFASQEQPQCFAGMIFVLKRSDYGKKGLIFNIY